MAHVFLSASVPLPDRDRRFYDSADILLIREALKALVETVLPAGTITCGGHPTITPLIALFARAAEVDRNRVVVYQASRFEADFPEENADFCNVVVVRAGEQSVEANLRAMRTQMISSREFDAAVFIGGMDGVLAEAHTFSIAHPAALRLPIASTGAAALELYRQAEYPEDLASDLTYSSLYRRHLGPLSPEQQA